jgi:hypothetical protein
MHRTKAIILLALMQIVVLAANAQTDTTTAVMNVNLQNNQASFGSSLRTLRQIPGAPSPFYTYFWEFGDGTFSFQENPRHIYKDTGTYNAILYATNNYDDGKAPPKRLKKIPVKQKAIYAVENHPPFFKENGSIEMKVNRKPKPDEDMVLIVGYRNKQANSSLNGSLVLFYNEREFRKNSFDVAEERTYYGERKTSIDAVIASIPSQEIMRTTAFVGASLSDNSIFSPDAFYNRRFVDLLKSKQQIFRQNTAWHFENLKQNEEKYFFITLHTTPEMIKDTNGVVTLTGMFVPDNADAEIEEYSMELAIVTSHDPNRMMLKHQRMNYRFTGSKKEMTYKVLFQNTGKGPAKQISVGIGVPSMLDSKSLEIVDYYPKCVLCKTARNNQSCLDTIIRNDSLFFVFKNIYLPGLHQPDFSDPDSTTGFVKYKIHFSKEMKKLPFDTKAALVFDKNQPVYTNGAKGYFKPGRSIGAIIGYNKLIGVQGKNNNHENFWMVGASISPFSPYKKYLQGEILVGMQQFPEELAENRTENKDTNINGNQHHIFARQIYQKQTIIKLDLVPLEIRYNIIDYAGAGLGTVISFDAYTKNNYREVLQVVRPPDPTPFTIDKTGGNSVQWFHRVDFALFADVQFGKVRVGPVAGVRYLHYFRFPQNRLFFYVSWRL